MCARLIVRFFYSKSLILIFFFGVFFCFFFLVLFCFVFLTGRIKRAAVRRSSEGNFHVDENLTVDEREGCAVFAFELARTRCSCVRVYINNSGRLTGRNNSTRVVDICR